ncbi:AraC family transcriptional regulator [Parabacteroides timonensis]|uniref:AraC family transcriptional regulator n=1 Tax=Parabacteroides timonensis TaxID=1871013 RepID=UPI00094EFA9B|nr:helix-turn-helix domain-containing protein [Parabacteroides timonensis]
MRNLCKNFIFTLLFVSVNCLANSLPQYSLPDTLLTEDYIYEYTFTDYDKAVRIIEEMRRRNLLPEHRLDIAEGDLYFNTGKYHAGLKYYRRALESDSVRNNDNDYMEQLHRMISSYDCLHDEARKAYYVELLLQKAKECSNLVMQSVALFNMGKMIYYQEDKERGYELVNEAITLMKESDYKYKYDNLRYNYNSLLIMQQRDKRYEEALHTLDLLAEVVNADIAGTPSIGGLAEKEQKTMYAQRAVLLSRLGRIAEADEAYGRWHSIGDKYMKDDYLICPYLMDRKRFDDVIELYAPREKFLYEQNDTINYHMMTIKRLLGRAYAAKGDYRSSSVYFEQLAVLTDSLKIREQKSAAIELATVYETNEKEAQIIQQKNQLAISRVWLVSAGIAVCLLALIIWLITRNLHIIRRKNRAMVKQMKEQFSFGEMMEKRIRELERDLLQTQFPLAGVAQPEVAADTANTQEQVLFATFHRLLTEEQLFKKPSLTRDEVVARLGVNKNMLISTLQQYAGISFTDYINNLRLACALELLSAMDDDTIELIAEKSGFGSVRTFYRLFRERYDMSPSDYKRIVSNP